MQYTKEFNLLAGDRVLITSGPVYPFSEGWAKGSVISAAFYETDGWYIEFDKDEVSPGWQTGYGYWKQGTDGGTVEKLSSLVSPRYSNFIMERVRQRLGLEPGDTSRDADINNMTRDSVFVHVLEWEGIIGYAGTIRGWIKDIYGVDVSTFGL